MHAGPHAGRPLDVGLPDGAAGGAAGRTGETGGALLAHLAAVPVMLAVGMAGCLLPIAMSLGHADTRVAAFTRAGTYFALGTVLATALLHMLPPVAEALAQPGLPAPAPALADAKTGVTSSCACQAYLIVLVAALAMHLLDYALLGWLSCRNDPAQEQLAWDEEEQGCGAGQRHSPPSSPAHRAQRLLDMLAASKDAKCLVPAGSDAAAGAAAAAEDGAAKGSSSEGAKGGAHAPAAMPPRARWVRQRQRLCRRQQQEPAEEPAELGTLLLSELGSALHSAMAGLALGMASGPAFPTLLAGLALQQFCEGFSIGTMAVEVGLHSADSATLALLLSLAAPAGAVVGTLVRAILAGALPSELVAGGLCDGDVPSAGVLLYVVLVGLIAPRMTDADWLHSRRWPAQVASFAAFYLGALTILVAKWV